MNTLARCLRFFLRTGCKILGLLILLFTSGMDVLLLAGIFAGSDFRARCFYAVFTVFFALLTYIILRIFFLRGSSLNLTPLLVALTGFLTAIFALGTLFARGDRGSWLSITFLFALQTCALLYARKFRLRSISPRRPPDGAGGSTALVPLVPKGPTPTRSAAAEWPVE